MKRRNEVEAVILAAGRQTRYKNPESKLMVKIGEKPAFFYTISSILKIIPPELITVVSSTLFQDFNDYLSHQFQDFNVVLNPNPGSGSAQTLAASLPWKTDLALVSEANIYYESYLICQMMQAITDKENIEGVLAVTPKTDIAPTHRPVAIGGKLNLAKRESLKSFYRNMGVYVLRENFGEKINQIPDIIDVLNNLNVLGVPLITIQYLGEYLHIATTDDVEMWKENFLNE
jgi:choline kinase